MGEQADPDKTAELEVRQEVFEEQGYRSTAATRQSNEAVYRTCMGPTILELAR